MKVTLSEHLLRYVLISSSDTCNDNRIGHTRKAFHQNASEIQRKSLIMTVLHVFEKSSL